MKRKFRLENGLEFIVGRECQFKLGIFVYPRITHFANNHYVVKFYIDKVPYLVRDLWVNGTEVLINFPTKKELDNLMAEKEAKKEK